MTIASDLLQQHIQTLVDDNARWQTLIADNILWELAYASSLGDGSRGSSPPSARRRNQVSSDMADLTLLLSSPCQISDARDLFSGVLAVAVTVQ